MFDLAKIRRISCVALVAMLMVVFAPTVGRVLAAERAGFNMVEVCTTEGTQWSAVSEPAQGGAPTHQQSPASVHDHGGDCPYCSLQTGKTLTSTTLTFATTPVASLLPALFYQAPKPLFAWAHSRSRAPPSAS